jgi:hypothetical protein
MESKRPWQKKNITLRKDKASHRRPKLLAQCLQPRYSGANFLGPGPESLVFSVELAGIQVPVLLVRAGWCQPGRIPLQHGGIGAVLWHNSSQHHPTSMMFSERGERHCAASIYGVHWNAGSYW